MELEDLLNDEQIKDIGKRYMNKYVGKNPRGAEFIVVFYDKEKPSEISEKAKSHFFVSFKDKKHAINLRSFSGLGAYNNFRFNGISEDNYIVKTYKKIDEEYVRFD
ncbi:hypothetical protein GF336_01685 [Candidatus Woesearchaeota archaeon]|nr:hypothetical protein [Candidatus Woesearchaeota archaeon]